MDQQQLQSIVQELQLVRGQIQSLTSQFNEISLTIEALKEQSPDRAVYRALGGVLLEVDDREALAEDLESSKDTIETHIQTLNEKESELRSQYTDAVDSLE
ncbi:MAG: prefoldin subunit [Candidatus Thalassarchaeum sp.]|nr:prefoldin subunit [Candidatus Thalassarchaeum sp.]MEC9351523.1 prefoldin subunit [Candidatus Thermoplasmatota archaeon]MED6312444.1 prefoldin subunit [Candidatus Thermoplasmatota archaeon]